MSSLSTSAITIRSHYLYNTSTYASTLSTISLRNGTATSSSTYPTATSPPPSFQSPPICPQDNNTIYITNTAQYVVECDLDHVGGDLSMTYVNNLEECILVCDYSDYCVDVSLSGEACYLKSSLGEAILAPGLSGARKLGVPNNATIPTCPQSNGTTYTSPSGANFTIECGVDHAGGDMGYLSMDRFPPATWLQSCIDSCGNMTSCLDVSLSGSACYLKSSVGEAMLDSSICGARLLDVESPTPSPSPTPEPEDDVCDTELISCPACNNTVVYSEDNDDPKPFLIECGIDHAGGDVPGQRYEHIGLREQRAFRNCLEDCAELDECVDVSFQGDTCYVKDTVGPVVYSDTVWGARLMY